MSLQVTLHHLSQQRPHELVRHCSASADFVLADLGLPRLDGSHQLFFLHHLDEVNLVEAIDEATFRLGVETAVETSPCLEASAFMSDDDVQGFVFKLTTQRSSQLSVKVHQP